MKYTWEHDDNVELWGHDDFDTKEDCIKDAKANYNVKPGDTIVVGKVFPYEVSVDAETVLDQIEENAYEICGEAADGWYLKYKREAVDELSERLTECVVDWLKEQNNMPDFYQVAEVETIYVE